MSNINGIQTGSVGIHQKSTDPEATTTIACETSVVNCTVCVRIGRILACCYNPSTWPCEECARIYTFLASRTPDPKSEHQLKSDRTEGLRLATKEFEAEDARLGVVLMEK
jgi:hypothetical protein